MARIVINQELCKGCQLCAVFCPPGVLAFSVKLNSHGYHPAVLADDARCTSCTACALVCPDVAITVYRPETGFGGFGGPASRAPMNDSAGGSDANVAAGVGR